MAALQGDVARARSSSLRKPTLRAAIARLPVGDGHGRGWTDAVRLLRETAALGYGLHHPAITLLAPVNLTDHSPERPARALPYSPDEPQIFPSALSSARALPFHLLQLVTHLSTKSIPPLELIDLYRIADYKPHCTSDIPDAPPPFGILFQLGRGNRVKDVNRASAFGSKQRRTVNFLRWPSRTLFDTRPELTADDRRGRAWLGVT